MHDYFTMQNTANRLFLYSLYPQLFVHVGVSGMATMVTLEKCGHNKGYHGLDVRQFCPDSKCCVDGGPECLHSVIDIDFVCKKATEAGMDVQFTVSTDAGRQGIYLTTTFKTLFL